MRTVSGCPVSSLKLISVLLYFFSFMSSVSSISRGITGGRMNDFLRHFQPYDPKRSCWVPMKDGGFAEGTIEKAEGDKVRFFVYQD